LPEQWPNLFIVGAAKAGTTSLHSYLATHPQIYMSPVKEPHYFSRLSPAAERRPFLPTVEDERAYLRLFRGAGECPLRGESSTSYLTVPEAAKRIRDRCPRSKALISLREPVDRAYSHFLADRRDGVERRSFSQAIEDELSSTEPAAWGNDSLYVEIGRYAEAVARYQRLFGPDLKVLFFEELTADPLGALRGVLGFLDLEPSDADGPAPKVHNPHSEPRGALARRLFTSPRARRLSRRVLPRAGRARVKASLTTPARKPPIEPADRARLEEIYHPQVEQLTALLGRRPPWPAYRRPGSTSSRSSAVGGDELAGGE
jgi:hypothetical protein